MYKQLLPRVKQPLPNSFICVMWETPLNQTEPLYSKCQLNWNTDINISFICFIKALWQGSYLREWIMNSFFVKSVCTGGLRRSKCREILHCFNFFHLSPNFMNLVNPDSPLGSQLLVCTVCCFSFAVKPTWNLKWDLEWLMRDFRSNVNWLNLMVNTLDFHKCMTQHCKSGLFS